MFKRLMNPWLMLVAGICCIAFSAIFVKLANINGLSAAFYRVFISAIALLPVFLLKGKTFRPRDAMMAFVCGLFFASDISLWYVSIMMTDATVATLLGNLSPLWTGVLGFFFYKVKPSRYYWIGTFVAINGVAILLGYHNIISMKVNAGFFLSISASVFYSLYLLTSKIVRSSLETVTFMMFALIGSVCATFVFCLVAGAPLWGFSAHTWLSLAGMGLISHLLGWLAINYALGHISSTEASITLLGQSVLTGIVASFILGEFLSWHQALGGVVVLAGIAIVYIKRKGKD